MVIASKRTHDLNPGHSPSPGQIARLQDLLLDDQVVDPLRMPLQSPDHLAFQMWLAQSKRAR